MHTQNLIKSVNMLKRYKIESVQKERQPPKFQVINKHAKRIREFINNPLKVLRYLNKTEQSLLCKMVFKMK